MNDKKRKKIFIVFNPEAHRAKTFLSLKGEILEILENNGRNSVQWEKTASPGDGVNLSRKAVQDGFDVIVAAGGDGTVNEVVNGALNTDVVFGVIPIGITNVLAKELKIGNDPLRASETILGGNTEKIDIGEINGKYFVLMAGAGLDAFAIEKLNKNLKDALGRSSYIISGLQHYRDYPHPVITVKLIDRKLTLQGYQVIVSNISRYGGEFKISKTARYDDGYLDVCIFQKKSLLDYSRYILGIVTSIHKNFQDVKIIQSKEIILEGEDVPYHIDSDLAGKLPAVIKVLNRACSFLVP